MKKHFTGVTMVFFFMLFVNGVGQDMNTNIEKEKKNLLEKDIEIAAASAKKGILKAFYPFITSQSLLFPENGFPVYGKKACEKAMESADMSGWQGKLQWEPLFADVSAAGDLGYTHGRFKRPGTTPQGKKKMVYSYYGTIWQRDTQGTWKVMVSQGLILLTNLAQSPAVNRMDTIKLGDAAKQVAEAEHAFSEYSVKHGIPEAFYHFIADDGIALSATGPPRSKESYAREIDSAKKKKETPGPKPILKWKPFFTYAAASGDMAYNYGPYEFAFTSAKGEKKTYYGCFITVWKKQPDKTWKFVFDGGQMAPGPF